MEKVVVTFKTGRGGRFNNGGHLSFYQICEISEVSYLEEHCSFDEGKQTYLDHNGDELDMCIRNDGTGYVNIDNEYHTYESVRIDEMRHKHFVALIDNCHSETDDILKSAIGENYEIFKAFDLIEEVFDRVDRFSELIKFTTLDWFEIEEITEAEYDELYDEDAEQVREVDGRFFKKIKNEH